MKQCLCLMTALLLAGCSDVGGIRLIIESENLVVDDDIDAIQLDIVANLVSHTDAEKAQTCPFVRRTIPGDIAGITKLEFPLEFGLQMNDEPWRCFGLRVLGLKNGDEVVRDEAYICPERPETEVINQTLSLTKSCHSSHQTLECEAYESCLGRGCLPTPLGGVFDAVPVEDEVYCDGAWVDPPTE